MLEAKLAGRAIEIDAAGPVDGSHRFRVDLNEVVHTNVGTPADHLVIESWYPGRGRQIRQR